LAYVPSPEAYDGEALGATLHRRTCFRKQRFKNVTVAFTI
jgi:hypothetical protein